MALKRLIELQSRITNIEDQLGARLFCILMLVHLLLIATLLPAINFFWEREMGNTIWDDQDAWVVIAGAVVIVVAFTLVRVGYFRTGAMLYILNTAVVALAAPFVPDRDAEIGLLASAVIPVLLAAIILSYWWVLGILSTSVLAATILLYLSNIPARQKGTGFALLVVVSVTGGLIIVFRHHLSLLERRRHSQIREGEEAIRKREEQYRNLFETVTDGIMIANLQKVILEVNQAACRQLGYTRKELIGSSLDKISGRMPADVSGTLGTILQRGNAFYETIHIKKDGGQIPVELAVTVIEFNGEKAFLGVARDLTERRRIEEDKQRLEVQLQHAVKMESIGMLAGGVAHDFNNLLTAILGNAEMALEDIPETSPASKKLEEILKASQSAASLTRQLLAFSRKQIISPRIIDLNELIGNMHNMLKRLIGEDIALKVMAGKDLYPVKADPGLVEQIVVNLTVNARDAMPDGGTLIIETANALIDAGTDAESAEFACADFVRLSISDTGVGIPKGVMDRIFEPFFTTKPKGRGTGLGLATSYGAVKQSGGYIYVDSQEGQGTEFRIYLPRAAKAVEQVSPEEKPPLHGHETILLVEDDQEVRGLAEILLKRLGYSVLLAGSGEEALELVQHFRKPIQLLITDVVMPGMNGRQLAEQFIALHPETKVLYTSGYTADAIVHRGVLDDALAFIAKPYTSKTLGTKIREVLGDDATPGP